MEVRELLSLCVSAAVGEGWRAFTNLKPSKTFPENTLKSVTM